MKPNLLWTVVRQVGINIYEVRLHGTDHKGEAVDKRVTFPEPVEAFEVNEMVAKMNAGRFR